MTDAYWLKASGNSGKPPSLAETLEMVALHVSAPFDAIERQPRGHTYRGGCGLWADPTGPVDGLHVHLEYEIQGTAPEGQEVWDHCRVRHYGAAKWEHVGNRCGLRNYIARAYAPVVAAVAARAAAECTAAESEAAA